MNRLLLIDDDQRLGRMLVSYLEGAGFVVEHTIDGKSGLEAARRSPPAAILLDLMLPDIDGLELCRRLRSQANTPILMLTARGEET
ncbi:MAG TPA: response regulator, partial [Myxococcota bacterium]|nr:response regulator [Myxococcota bacterium]